MYYNIKDKFENTGIYIICDYYDNDDQLLKLSTKSLHN